MPSKTLLSEADEEDSEYEAYKSQTSYSTSKPMRALDNNGNGPNVRTGRTSGLTHDKIHSQVAEPDSQKAGYQRSHQRPDGIQRARH